jgi:NTP pyrophosphatase (non-canonical NTP hydrolase)
MNITALSNEVYEINVANGWYEADRTFAEGIALLHSEVSEALEAYRLHGVADHTTIALTPLSMKIPQVQDILVRAEARLHAALNEGRGITRENAAIPPEEWKILAAAGVAKPEGVGSELADVMIRVLDESRRQNIDLEAAMVAHVGPPERLVADTSLPSHLAGLHYNISRLYLAVSTGVNAAPDQLAWIFSYIAHLLVGIAKHHGIDLEYEIDRKLAYNQTRGHKHGGKLL